MEVGKIQQHLASNSRSSAPLKRQKATNFVKSTAANSVSFQGASGQLSKKSWLFLRNLSESMRNVSEITNAVIAAIGTGIIAPAIILVSPGKGDKEDKDKKFLQAIRQPLSALLALFFQVPATMGINKLINHFAYEKKAKFFDDKTLGALIPDKPYIYNNITKKELEARLNKFEDATNGKSLKQRLEDKIRKDHEEVGLSISDDDLAKRVNKNKKEFVKRQIVEEKYSKLIDEKVAELQASGKDFKIQDTDLVTDDYKQLAIHRNKQAYKELAEKENLSIFDKIAQNLGLSTKKTKALEKAQKEFATSKGLELMKEDNMAIFSDPKAKLKQFVENHQKTAKKAFGNKKFFISLFVNLFMVTASCYALNWAHPRLKELIDKVKANKAEQQQPANDQKVEVK
ncbi:hypothetical protein IJZ97_04440 [bacterium]|nr:hypothetical protein [bacterium]